MVPFVEKYRPESLKDLCGPKILFDESNGFSNIILHGPSGTGKSTAVRAFLKNISNDSILKIERSRNDANSMIQKLTSFVSKKTTFHKKFVVVDEVDTISIDHQKIFARPFENDINGDRKQNVVVFIFICNRIDYVSDIIRKNCIEVEYEKLPFNEISRYLRRICTSEGIQTTDETLNYIYIQINRDLRKTISTLEFLCAIDKTITESLFNKFHKKFDSITEIELMLKHKTLNEVIDVLHNNIESVIEFCVELLRFHKSKGFLNEPYLKLLADMCIDSKTTRDTWFILWRLIRESPYFF